MTQAPTPGPMSQGDIVRGPNGQIETVKTANPDFVVLASGNGYLPSLVTFIGRPDESGWMPWSGGENPVPGTMVERKERSGDLVWCACLSDDLRWSHSGWDTDIIAFRLAPTAPVEASGSERDGYVAAFYEIADMLGIGAQAASPAEVWSRQMRPRLAAALSPQPSGETRELVARIIDGGLIHYGADGVHVEDLNGKLLHEKYSNMEEASQALAKLRTDAILALLSARPLALGGQQGEEAAWSWLNQHVECDPADRDYSADEMVDAFMAGNGRYDRLAKALERIAGEHQYRSGYCQTDITVEPALTAEEAQTVARDALSTTPARAEAQDEGAAGEASAYRVRMISNDPAEWVLMHPEKALDFLSRKGWESQALYAHPSPTPAADADRVREEETEVQYEVWGAGPQSDFCAGADTLSDAQHYAAIYGQYGPVVIKVATTSRVVWSEASLALKSTAAKEGGAK